MKKKVFYGKMKASGQQDIEKCSFTRSPLIYEIYLRLAKHNSLLGCLCRFFVVFEPILLDRGGFSAAGLALDLNLLGLVCLQVTGNVGFLG